MVLRVEEPQKPVTAVQTLPADKAVPQVLAGELAAAEAVEQPKQLITTTLSLVSRLGGGDAVKEMIVVVKGNKVPDAWRAAGYGFKIFGN